MALAARLSAVAALAGTGTVGPALACGPMATVTFVETSTDRFEIVNNSGGAWAIARVDLDLDGSAGGLIFDTDGGGLGISGFEPFGGGRGDVEAVVPPQVSDGDRALTLEFAGFVPGARFSFTIDVDDTLPLSELGQMRVSDAEIYGALVRATFGAPDGQAMTLAGHFGPDAVAIVSGLACS